MSSHPARIACALAVAIVCLNSPVFAEQVAVRHFNVADGLPSPTVGGIYEDSKGYVWFGTADGLTRFDGHRFISYGVEDGLPNPVVSTITEDHEGRLWIATYGGIARLLDDPREYPPLSRSEGTSARPKKFVAYQVGATEDSNAVSHMFFDSEGALWCTSDEIYGATFDSAGQPKFEIAITRKPGWAAFTALADSHGRLWFGLPNELIEYAHDAVIRYSTRDAFAFDRSLLSNLGLPNEQIMGIAEDSQGSLFVANRRELFEFIPDGGVFERGHWKKRTLPLPASLDILRILVGSQGDLWIGTSAGLLRYKQGPNQIVGTAQVLTSDRVIGLFEDRRGDVWVGTVLGGVHRYARSLIVSYTEADGLGEKQPKCVLEDKHNRIYLLTANTAGEVVNGRVSPIRGAPAHLSDDAHRLLCDKRGDFWLTSSGSLLRFSGPALQFSTGKKFTVADGAPAGRDFGHALCEDHLGRIWCGANLDAALYVYDPDDNNSQTFKRIPLTEPSLNVMMVMVEDKSGSLWLGSQGAFGRYVRGKTELIHPGEGLPQTLTRDLFIDSRGWLWIGLERGGVSVTRDPSAEVPTFVNYSTGTGLSSNTVYGVAEDQSGRMYFGTSKGLDRLDPQTGHYRHFGIADGLAAANASKCIADSQGNIWITTSGGLSMLNPRAEKSAGPPPPVYFDRVRVAGEDIWLPERGAQQVPVVELPEARNNLLIEYIAPGSQGSDLLKYQHKLEGVDKDWSEPGNERSVNYPRLGSGSYRFLVRTIDSESFAGGEPAAFEFRVLPPIWQRWWFLGMVALIVAAGAFSLHRFRIRQIIAMERVRQQVAADLHDDVGSGLAQIAILTEVAKRESTPAATGLLNEVADLARSMRGSMSDIVWAIDPRKDSVADLVQRMRQVSFNLLEANGVRVEFRAPADGEIEGTGMAADRRRHLLLIFKEAITNVSRHSGASCAMVEIGFESRELRLRISDDGHGFDVGGVHEGHGVYGMRQRTAGLNGRLEVESSDAGTIVELAIPLR